MRNIVKEKNVLETVTRCAICHREDCDGKTWQTPDMYGSYGHHIGVKVVCRHCEGIIWYNKKPVAYRVTSGHGDYSDYPLHEL